MYTHYFSLKQSPFSIAPDPRYLYMSERHREALAHLLYGIGSGGGFVLLTGEIGAGKTTVCRCFMEQIPANCKLAYIFNPKLSVPELLQSVCDEFGIAPPEHSPSIKGYVDAINGYLLASHAQGRNNVLIIDEAQNLSAEVLEQLRLLTNLETSERKLLQIILIGQPELRTMLARPELEQLAQRVIARYHLGSLSEDETGAYVEHRLAVAGATAIAPFPRRLMGLVHQLAKGVPRRINLLCDRALLGAYVENQPQVTRAILRRAAQEVFEGQAVPTRFGTPRLTAAAVAGLVLLAAGAWYLGARPSGAADTPAVRAAQGGEHGATKVGAQARAPAAGTGQAASSAAGAGAAVAGAGAPAGSGAAAPVAAAMSVPASGIAAAAPQPETSSAVLRSLAALWGEQLPDGDACQAAARMNLRCLPGKGGVADLRLLDRPAMLTLHDDPTRPTYALLTAIHGDAATVRIAGRDQHISLQALEARFDGEYTTFWRAPRSWRDQVSSGDRGPDVDWLARRLAQIYGLNKPQDSQPLDADLRRRLVEFQAAQHLKADGVAGPKTFIRLYQLGGVQEPRLLAVAGK